MDEDQDGMTLLPMQQFRRENFEGLEQFGLSLIAIGKDMLIEDGSTGLMIYGVRVKSDGSAIMNILSAETVLKAKDGKKMLIEMLRAMSDTFAWTHMFMLREAKVTVVEQDSAIGQLVASGTLRMQDLPTRKDGVVVQIFSEDGNTHAISCLIERDEAKKITGFKDANSTFKDAKYKTESIYNPWRKDDHSNSRQVGDSTKKQ